MMDSRIILILLSIMISACSSPLKSVKKNHILKKNHVLNKENGVVLTKLQTNSPFRLAIKNSSGDVIWLKNKASSKTNNILAVSLPSGKYFLHKIALKNKDTVLPVQDIYSFKIKKGKVNYICDLGGYFKKTNRKGISPKLEFILPIYLKSDTEKEFNKYFPKLSKKYPLISSPVANCVRGQSEKARQLMTLLNK